jgi:pimeloyl-ACP methyl ester carboxylesterase
MIGLEMATRWPERIHRAILMGLTVFLTPEERAQGQTDADADVAMLRPRADGAHCMNIMTFALGTNDPAVKDVHNLARDMEFVNDWIVDGTKAGLGFIDMAKKVRSFDIWPKLPLVKVPTLIIGLHGTNLYWGCKGERTRAAQAKIPGSRLVMLEGADTDMAVTYTHAKELVDLVVPFLQDKMA